MDFWDELYNKHFRIWEHPSINNDVVNRKTPIIIEETVATPVEAQPEETIEAFAEKPAEAVDGNGEKSDGDKAVEEVPKPAIVAEIPQVKPEVVEDTKPQIVEVIKEVEEVKKVEVTQKVEEVTQKIEEVHVNGNGTDASDKKVEKKRTSNEIKMVQNSNGVPKDVIRANDPPEDDLPKNIGVNKFVNFFESLGGKK